jgi:hypothetical protein
MLDNIKPTLMLINIPQISKNNPLTPRSGKLNSIYIFDHNNIIKDLKFNCSNLRQPKTKRILNIGWWVLAIDTDKFKE